MYNPAQFREDRPETQFELVAEHPLGLLVTKGPVGLVANFIPLIAYPNEGDKGVLHGHVARANAQWQDLAKISECLTVFRGPQAYISPTWYPSKTKTLKVVPTWNYATVHVWGQPRAVEDTVWLRRQIDDLTQLQEGQRPNPWKVSEAPADFVGAQIQAIVGIEISITRIEGKWKMSQNRIEADRRGAIEGLQAQGGVEGTSVAALIASRSDLLPDG